MTFLCVYYACQQNNNILSSKPSLSSYSPPPIDYLFQHTNKQHRYRNLAKLKCHSQRKLNTNTSESKLQKAKPA